MGRTAHQKQRQNGTRVSLFTGLAAKVDSVARSISGVDDVKCAGVSAYQGKPLVKISWGKGAPLTATVCDADHGARRLRIEAFKHGAVSRKLRKKLEEKGINVPRTKCNSQTATM